VIIDDPGDSGCGQVVDSNYTGIIQGVRYGGWDFRSRGSLVGIFEAEVRWLGFSKQRFVVVIILVRGVGDYKQAIQSREAVA